MSICPQAFLTGQSHVVASFRGGVIEMLSGSGVLDAVLEKLDAIEPADDSLAYISAAGAAVNHAYADAVQALGKSLT